MTTEPLPAEQRVQVIRDCVKQWRNSHPDDIMDVFIETGSCDGYTTAALINDFDYLCTIELDPDFYQMCIERFRKEKKVICLYGDSAHLLPFIIERVADGHCVTYWLDAHYDGRKTRGAKDTPIMEELAAIWTRPEPDLILIDDARLFGTDPAYPTLNDINNFISPLTLEVKDDIIRIFR